MLYVTPDKTTTHIGSASFALSTWGFNAKVAIWTGIVGVVASVVVATVLTPLLAQLPRGSDEQDLSGISISTAERWSGPSETCRLLRPAGRR